MSKGNIMGLQQKVVCLCDMCDKTLDLKDENLIMGLLSVTNPIEGAAYLEITEKNPDDIEARVTGTYILCKECHKKLYHIITDRKTKD